MKVDHDSPRSLKYTRTGLKRQEEAALDRRPPKPVLDDLIGPVLEVTASQEKRTVR